MKSYDNLMLDLKLFRKAKLRIKVQDHDTSDRMDMLAAGIHGTLLLKQDKQRTNKSSPNYGKSIEVGTSIKFCSYPFIKTRVIRFTKQF